PIIAITTNRSPQVKVHRFPKAANLFVKLCRVIFSPRWGRNDDCSKRSMDHKTFKNGKIKSFLNKQVSDQQKNSSLRLRIWQSF
ncbi:MAG: hypothetical protein Q4B70_17595, partial [Lachnospiraceae bacterium]|nr:hypothetical protein [Lachnospiraceae bacterium]